MGRNCLRCLATADHHLSTTLKKTLADAATDTFATAGDQYHFAAKVHRVVHGEASF
ncbi:hypothetical protein D3C78_1618070 [compost metagenome]